MEATPGDTIWDGWRDGWISLTSEFRRARAASPSKNVSAFFDVVFIFRRHFGRQLDSRVAFIGCNIEASRRSASKLPTCQDFVDLRNLIYRRSITRIIRSMKAFSRWRTLKQRINRCRDDDKPNGQQERSKGPHHCARPELGLVWRRKSRVRENCARVRNWTEEPSRLWSLEGGDDFRTTRRHATHAKAFG